MMVNGGDEGGGECGAEVIDFKVFLGFCFKTDGRTDERTNRHL